MSRNFKTRVDSGKYTIAHDNGANVQILRNGFQWFSAGDADTVLGQALVALASEMDSLRAKLALPDAEPVAWRRLTKFNFWEYEDGVTSFPGDPSAYPLYLAPQPAIAPEPQEPATLTTVEICAVIKASIHAKQRSQS